MEPEPSISLLPRRGSQKIARFSNATPVTFRTNMYGIELNKSRPVYQMVMETTPEVPADSKDLIRRIQKCINRELKEKLGFVIFSGLMLWGFKNIKTAMALQAQVRDQQEANKYDILIKPVKQVDIQELMLDPIKSVAVRQVLNSMIKNILSNLNYVELTRGKYFQPQGFQIPQVGLDYRRGFKFTLCQMRKGLKLQIDVCNRLSQSCNLLEELNNKSMIDANNEYVGMTVITRYGKIRTYKILKIDSKFNPKSEFFNSAEGGKISYAKYYELKYGVKIKDLKQPLILSVSHVEKKIDKKTQKLVEIPHEVYLIPELVSLTGMTDRQRSDHRAMKEVATYTQMKPQERVQQTENLNSDFNHRKNNEYLQILNAQEAHGFQLHNINIQMGSGSQEGKNGSFVFKNTVKNPANFEDWLFVYSGTKGKEDVRQADTAVDNLQYASKTFGIQVKDPSFIEMKSSNLNEWISQLKTDIEKNGKPQIIVLYVQNKEEKFYGPIKKFLSVQMKIPSQFIRRRTISQKDSKSLSAASKIICQMNAKLGLSLWQVPQSIKSFGTKKIMYGGISFSKGKKGFTLAFVGTINNLCSAVYSEAITGIKEKQKVPKATFDSIFKRWLKAYFKNNKNSFPQQLIIYREGLAEAQIQKYVQKQVQSLIEACKTAAQKAKTKFNPKILFIGVNKKISMRFFEKNGKSSGGKFVPQLNNPSSGSVIVEDLSVDKLMDFHLAAQKVNQGTCTPTQYLTIYKNFDFEIEQLAQFTFGQCFNYYNWTGAVRVPACLQCADKLAKLAGQSIESNVEDIGGGKYHFL